MGVGRQSQESERDTHRLLGELSSTHVGAVAQTQSLCMTMCVLSQVCHNCASFILKTISII